MSGVTKSVIKKKYEQLDKAARKHAILEFEFGKMECEYYGFNTGDASELHNDDFISGMHLGEGGDFEIYNEMMIRAKEKR